MIVLFVHPTSGLIGKWVDVSVDDIESQSIPSSHVAVVSDRQPNYTGEAYVTDITRAPELDIPYIAIEFYTATIDERRPPRLPITSYTGTSGFTTAATGGRFIRATAFTGTTSLNSTAIATFVRITSFAGTGDLGTAGTISP